MGFRSPVAAGAILSITSPYFLIWWATVGASLILASIEFGLIGFVLLAVFHWLCDFIWFYFLSAVSFKSRKFFGQVFQKVIFAVCGLFLIVMGVKFIVDAVKILTA
jgi:threonine/homoserine/homoserine lactone efflux protein